mgnify:CR=1 FL=1
MKPISGAQYTLVSGDYVAVIASVGATLRSLTYQGRNLVMPFEADEIRPGMRGALLAPWPNRTADGAYVFQGGAHQLAVNEIETNNASHGLVCWLDFEAVTLTPERVELRAWVQAQPGYPWRLEVTVTFELDERGLQQEVSILNASAQAAPVGIGGHPYLVAGEAVEGALNDWELTLPASRALVVNERRLPVDEISIAGDAELDFRSPRRVGATVLDRAFTDLTFDADGLARVRLIGPDGRGVELTWDERCPWTQVYSADAPGVEQPRHSIAVEPMTCPPNAFVTGRDLLAVEPGEAVSAGWRIAGV